MRLIYVNSSKVTKLEQKMNNSESFLLLLKNLLKCTYQRYAFSGSYINASAAHPSIEVSITYINRSKKGLLPPRTFKHRELLHKAMYLVLNFKKKSRYVWTRFLGKGVQAPGCKFAPGANCAHEHYRKMTIKTE